MGFRQRYKYIPIYITIRYIIYFPICQMVFFIPLLYYLIKLLRIKLIITIKIISQYINHILKLYYLKKKSHMAGFEPGTFEFLFT